MNLQGIVAVSGKPGLWKALAQNKTGYILEGLDAHKTKLVANIATAKIAGLHEITIFGLDEDIKLTDVFEQMKSAPNIPDAKADGKTLRAFFREVSPNHDEEKVYASDMKKIIGWYHILKGLPLFNEPLPNTPVTEEAQPAQETEKPTETVAATAAKPKVKAKKPAAKQA